MSVLFKDPKFGYAILEPNGDVKIQEQVVAEYHPHVNDAGTLTIPKETAIALAKFILESEGK